MFEAIDICVEIEGEKVLDHFSLSVLPGEIHVLMGPNGAGKSTFARMVSGDPSYRVTNGSLSFLEKNLLDLSAEERAREGIFMGFQHPVEVPGVTNGEFLYASYVACKKHRGETPLGKEDFRLFAQKKMTEIEMDITFFDRDVNAHFSGGEKKRNEILQLALLNPKLAILDETDSGLDVDAMRIIAKGVKREIGPNQGLILITHYYRLLELIPPDFVHIVIDGKIVQSGGIDLAIALEEKGYEGMTTKGELV